MSLVNAGHGPPEPESSSNALPQGAKNKRDDIKSRLDEKNSEIQAGRKFLECLKEWLQKYEQQVPEFSDWIEDIESIFQRTDIPRIVLGFIGSSGCGKSSVINAIIDEESLLPSNCSEACTAVPVEICYNYSDDRSEAYKAKIEFISAEEWRHELDVLVADVVSLEPGVRLSSRDEGVRAAWDKIKAVYPDITIDGLTNESPTELMLDPTVARTLGGREDIVFPEGQGREFSTAISPFIDSGRKPKTRLWPLVKLVRVYIRSRVLSTGLVLVDLPGSGDINSAREMAAEKYMQEASAICILANINRALTSAVAKRLFGRGYSLKRRLLKDGLLNEDKTFFVLTMTDIINNQQVLDREDLLRDMAEVKEVLEAQDEARKSRDTVTDRVEELKDRFHTRAIGIEGLLDHLKSMTESRKRKRDEGSESTSGFKFMNPDLNALEKEIKKKQTAQQNCGFELKGLERDQQDLNGKLQKLDGDLTRICIKARNDHVTAQMGVDFVDGVLELYQELEEEDSEGSSASNPIRLEAQPVRTFCVCSKAFQKLLGRFKTERLPAGFQSLDDTMIPQLQKYCQEFTLGAREKMANDFLEDFGRMKSRIRGWGDNSTPDKQITTHQKRQLDTVFRKHSKTLEKALEESITDLIKVLEGSHISMSADLDAQIEKAIRRSPEVITKWRDEITNSATLRAICRKGGVHQSRRKHEGILSFNFNKDLGEVVLHVLDMKLMYFLQRILPVQQKKFNRTVQAAVTSFPLEFRTPCAGVTPHINGLVQNFFLNLEQLQSSLGRSTDECFRYTVEGIRIADQGVAKHIATAMGPGYKIGVGITGKSSLHRIQTQIRHHVDNCQRGMYQAAADDTMQVLENNIIILEVKLKKRLKMHLEQMCKHFVKMLEIARTTPRPNSSSQKRDLQVQVLQKLAEFEHALAEAKANRSVSEGENESGGMKAEPHEDKESSETNVRGIHIKDEVNWDEIEFQAFSDEEGSDI